MITLTITILTILLITSVYVNYNALKKIEKQEDYIKELEEALLGFDAFVARLYFKCKNGLQAARVADKLGSFESDDETGAIFTSLKDIIEDINKEFEWQENEAETSTTSPKIPNEQ